MKVAMGNNLKRRLKGLWKQAFKGKARDGMNKHFIRKRDKH